MTVRTAFFLAAVDLRSGETIASQRLPAVHVKSVFEREIDMDGEGEEGLVFFEPLSLFGRRLEVADEEARAVLATFIEKVQHQRHSIILLLKGDAVVKQGQLAAVKEAMLEYYAVPKL